MRITKQGDQWRAEQGFVSIVQDSLVSAVITCIELFNDSKYKLGGGKPVWNKGTHGIARNQYTKGRILRGISIA